MAGRFLALKIILLFLILLAVFAVVFVSLDGKAILARWIRKEALKVVATAPAPTTAPRKTDNVSKGPLTLNLRGRSGCLVCHSDKNAAGSINGEIRSIYVDEALFVDSPHKDLTCLSCHLDFSYTHPVEVGNYRKVAGLACYRCHDHRKQAEDYRSSVHGRLALSGDPKEGATCGDCHGAHNIKSLKKSKEYRLTFRASSKEVCGGCHQKEYQNYNDYYHGRAYKRGAPDAPTCWDCHNYHNVLPAKETASAVSKVNLAKTCERCHRGSTRKFAEYALLIHGRKAVEEKNLVLRYKDFALKWVNRIVKPYRPVSGNWYAQYVKPYLEKVRSWFFPQSLRPKE